MIDNTTDYIERNIEDKYINDKCKQLLKAILLLGEEYHGTIRARIKDILLYLAPKRGIDLQNINQNNSIRAERGICRDHGLIKKSSSRVYRKLSQENKEKVDTGIWGEYGYWEIENKRLDYVRRITQDVIL